MIVRLEVLRFWKGGFWGLGTWEEQRESSFTCHERKRSLSQWGLEEWGEGRKYCRERELRPICNLIKNGYNLNLVEERGARFFF